MDQWAQMLITVVCAVIASSGFWAWLQKKNERKDEKTKMLIGLAHDRIVELGLKYVNRGWVTQDEYENLVDYLYSPYHKLGGNGSAERIVENGVKKIKIVKNYAEGMEIGGNDSDSK